MSDRRRRSGDRQPVPSACLGRQSRGGVAAAFARILPGLLALLAAPAAANTGQAAYLAARAAEADGRGGEAVGDYARALTAAPGDPVVAIRAYRAAIAGGDAALVRRASSSLASIGVAPADAPLFALADAARVGDREGLKRAATALSGDRLRIVAPILNAWAAGGAAGIALLDAANVDAVARPLAAENRALLLIASGRVDEGVAAVQSLAAARSRAGLRLAAAELLVGAGRPDRAATLLKARVTAAQPTLAFGVSRLLLRLAEEVGGDRASTLGLALARAALDADPAYDRARLMLASQLARSGDVDAALAALSRIAAGGPLAEEVLAARVQLLGDAEALAAARAGAAASDATTIDRARLADLLMAADRPAEAVPIYARVVDEPKLKNSPAAWLRYGGALDEAGRWKDARRALRRAVKLAPNDPQVLNYLGYALADRGEDLPEATSLLERARTLAPDDQAIADSLGWAYHRAGDTARALPLIESAAQASPDNAEIAEHLGDLYWTLGRNYEARYSWRAAAIVATPREAVRLAGKIEGGAGGR